MTEDHRSTFGQRLQAIKAARLAGLRADLEALGVDVSAYSDQQLERAILKVIARHFEEPMSNQKTSSRRRARTVAS